MPRSRNSIAEAELKGTAQQNAGRYTERKNAPVTMGEIGKPPKYLSKEEKAIWREVIQSIPAGVAGVSDAFAVELAVRYLHQFRTDKDMSASKVAILMNLLSHLGLDPQGRTRLQIQQPSITKETRAIDRFNAARTHGSSTVQ